MNQFIKNITKEILIPMSITLKDLNWRNPYLLVSKIYVHVRDDSLYRNSIFLMLSTFIMGIVGFFFWIVNTRLYSTEQIGYATSLISLTSLINGLSLLGLNSAIIQYLPKYKQKNELINTTFTLTFLMSVGLTIVYLFFLNVFSPKLLFIRDNPYLLGFFIFFVALSAINTLSDSVFIAYKATGYVLIYDTLYSITRLLMPFFLISIGTIGIFLSHTTGVVFCLLLTLYFLYKNFAYKFSFSLNISIIKDISKFSLGNYSASLIGGLPSTLYPIIVLNQLGAKISAYYYMDMMIVGFLYMIPIAISQSLFAEGSHNQSNLKEYLIKSTRINLLILAPAIAFTMLVGKYILLVFGKDYVNGGLLFLWIMAISTLNIPINYTFGAYFKIHKKVALINLVTTLSTILTLALSYILVNYLGIYGIAVSLISGQLMQTILYTIFIYFK